MLCRCVSSFFIFILLKKIIKILFQLINNYHAYARKQSTYLRQQLSIMLLVHRKILGASVSNIVTILSKDFSGLICIAFVIASPLAYWLMNKWLSDYTYRVDIKWWVFGLAGVSILLIALMTVSVQAFKAALANEGRALRTE